MCLLTYLLTYLLPSDRRVAIYSTRFASLPLTSDPPRPHTRWFYSYSSQWLD